MKLLMLKIWPLSLLIISACSEPQKTSTQFDLSIPKTVYCTFMLKNIKYENVGAVKINRVLGHHIYDRQGKEIASLTGRYTCRWEIENRN